MSDERMPIGRFARAVRLSIKALRHYDELGLLVPAHVDRRNGYRYYARAQARDAIAIGLLRRLDVPLESIRALLGAQATERAALLDRERERGARELRRRELALRSLERVMRAGSLLPYEVERCEVPAQRFASLRFDTDEDRHVDDTTRKLDSIFAALARIGVTEPSDVMTLVPEPMGESGFPLIACVSVPRELALPAPLVALELDACRCARVRHVGPYDELGLAHHALFAWAQAEGQGEPGALREVYVDDPRSTAPEALRTDVLLPLAD